MAQEDAVLAALLELRQQVIGIEQHLQRGTQLTFTFKQAASVLGRESAKTVSRMVKKGELTTVKICGSEMIPLSELQRIATPRVVVRKGGAPKKSTYSVADELAKSEELLRKRRRR